MLRQRLDPDGALLEEKMLDPEIFLILKNS
jgi:hypothetical protein